MGKAEQIRRGIQLAYLIPVYWPWLAAAFIVGVLISYISPRLKDRVLPSSVAVIGVVIFAVGLGLALAATLGGRLGLLLEIAVLAYAAYAVGGGLGWLLGGGRPMLHINWWLGLVAVALIVVLAQFIHQAGIETDLRARAADAAEAAGGDPLNLDVAGRDVLLLASADRRSEITEAVLAVPGVSRVAEVPEFTGTAKRLRAAALALREAEAKAAKQKSEFEALLEDLATTASASKASLEAGLKQAQEKAEAEAKARAEAEKAMSQVADKAATERESLEASLSQVTERAEQAAAARAEVEQALEQASDKAAAEQAALEERLKSATAQAAERAELEKQLQAASERAEAEQASLKAALDTATQRAEREEAARTMLEKAMKDAVAKSEARQAELEASLEQASAKAEREAAARAELEKAAEAERAKRAAAEAARARCREQLSALIAAEPILFASNSISLPDTAKPTLDRAATILAGCPEAEIEVSGHSDSFGLEVGNLFISQRRADAVLDYLANAGVKLGELSAVGHGATEPVAPNDTKEGMEKNRRVEFVVR